MKKPLLIILIFAVILLGLVYFISRETNQTTAVATQTIDPSICFQSVAQSYPANQWQEYDSSSSSFSVLFPGKGDLIPQDDVNIPPWNPSSSTFAWPTLVSEYAVYGKPYWVTYSSYPPSLDMSNPQRILLGMVNWAAQGDATTIATSSYVSLDGYPAIDYVYMTRGGGCAQGRSILVGNKLYQIFEDYTTSTYNASDYAKFVGSFKFE